MVYIYSATLQMLAIPASAHATAQLQAPGQNMHIARQGRNGDREVPAAVHICHGLGYSMHACTTIQSFFFIVHNLAPTREHSCAHELSQKSAAESAALPVQQWVILWQNQ